MADNNMQITKVNQLRPMATGLNLIVKVIDVKITTVRGRTTGRFSESYVGDETGIVVFSARTHQVDTVREGATLVLSNAKVNMFKGSMRLVVDSDGRLEVGEPVAFTVDESNNLSMIEFEKI